MIHFDTYQYVTTLKKAGVPEKEAEALSRAQQTSLSKCLDSSLASKQDVVELKSEVKEEIIELRSELKQDITELRSELKHDMTELRSELKQEMTELRTELKQDIAEHRLDTKMEIKNLESKVNLHSSMLGIIIAGIGTLILKAFF